MATKANAWAIKFKKAIWSHYRAHGRTRLPWRKTRDPYAILVSEIMLQQTQVARVEGYYGRFLERFPDFAALAGARTDDVLRIWQGLGYNRRALSLKKLAETVVKDFGGKLPRDRVRLEALPGIGKGTSGSLAAFAFNQPEIFIETNIRRVFIHFFFPRAKTVTDDEIRRYIESTIDRKNPREWYWALMDYGSSMPESTGASVNPNRKSAHYRKQSAFKGSDREIRGKILRYLLAGTAGVKANNCVKMDDLSALTGIPGKRLENIVGQLVKEGFIIRKRNSICIK